MRDVLFRFWNELAGRVSGPMGFRIVLQPLVAALFALRSGLRDAREGRPPYLWSLLAHAGRRGENVRSAWTDLGRVILTAFALDVLYQRIVLRAFHPVDAAIVAVLIVVAPYVALRGLVNRGARAFRRPG